MATFEHLRINLTRPELPPILAALDRDVVPEPRLNVLQRIFEVRQDFFYRGKKCSFIPTGAPDGFIAGYFAREGRLTTADANLQPVEFPGWEKALFLLDLDPAQQIAVLQHHAKVGHPRPLLEALFDAIQRYEAQYQFHVEYLVDERTYWDVVDKFSGEITKITFTFLPPNAFKSKEKVISLLQELTPETGTDKAKFVYESKDGNLNPRSDLLEASAQVAMEGAGDISVMADGRMVFSSSQGRRKTAVDADQIPEPGDDRGLGAMIRRLFRRPADG